MNVLIIGLGSIAKKHIEAIRKLIPDAIIYALRSHKQSIPNEEVTSIFSLTELIKISIDFAIISNPTSKHMEALEIVELLGCPLFIEKPLYHKLEIKSLVDKISQKDILTYVACNLRFLDVLNEVKNRIDVSTNKINEVNIYCGSFLPDWRPGTNYKSIYSAKSELGGGVHIDLIHEIDYVYWIFGKPVQIRKTFKSNSQLDIDSYDYANYCLEYEKFCVSIILNYYRIDKKRSFEIVFENETWYIDLIKNSIRIGNEEIFKSTDGIIDTYLKQMKYFINLVKTKKRVSINSISESYKVLEICLNDEKARE